MWLVALTQLKTVVLITSFSNIVFLAVALAGVLVAGSVLAIRAEGAEIGLRAIQANVREMAFAQPVGVVTFPMILATAVLRTRVPRAIVESPTFITRGACLPIHIALAMSKTGFRRRVASRTYSRRLLRANNERF
jgi:hypothetical protein